MIYSGAKKSSAFAYKNALNVSTYIFPKSQDAKLEAEPVEKLSEGWVFVLHPSKHNNFLANLQSDLDRPDILFTHQNLLLKPTSNHRNSSLLIEKTDELREFNELYSASKIREREEDNFSILDLVPDYDDLDYAVAMPAEEIERIFEEYKKKHPDEVFEDNKAEVGFYKFGFWAENDDGFDGGNLYNQPERIRYPELYN